MTETLTTAVACPLLTTIDEGNREGLDVMMWLSVPSRRVTRALDELVGGARLSVGDSRRQPARFHRPDFRRLVWRARRSDSVIQASKPDQNGVHRALQLEPPDGSLNPISLSRPPSRLIVQLDIRRGIGPRRASAHGSVPWRENEISRTAGDDRTESRSPRNDRWKRCRAGSSTLKQAARRTRERDRLCHCVRCKIAMDVQVVPCQIRHACEGLARNRPTDAEQVRRSTTQGRYL